MLVNCATFYVLHFYGEDTSVCLHLLETELDGDYLTAVFSEESAVFGLGLAREALQ